MLASDAGSGDELRDLLMTVLWLLPVAAGLCAGACAVFLGVGRRLREAGETCAATARTRNAMATGTLAVFLAACWGAALWVIG
ncbi:hypothetical protein [Streptomyces sp. NPDC020489]|uniref:hypothetical protein n=1 Tax=Streptomyces sp. NPDC020489 TaxID=3365077 RepID=UPI0037BC3979